VNAYYAPMVRTVPLKLLGQWDNPILIQPFDFPFQTQYYL
jgi:hypothetical protein